MESTTYRTNNASRLHSDEGEGSRRNSNLSTTCLQGSSLNNHEISRACPDSFSDSARDGHNERAESETPSTINGRDRRTKQRKIGAITASFNIKGRKTYPSRESKYKFIAKAMRRDKILAMGLTETKLKNGEEALIEMETKSIMLFNNPNPENVRAGGTAFAVNKELGRSKDITHDILIPGIASRLRIKVSDDFIIDMLNVYMPNIEKDAIITLKKLIVILATLEDTEYMQIMGDWNFVEFAEDRSPPRRDNQEIVNLMKELRNQHKIVDGWRCSNKEASDFSYIHDVEKGIMSRIDRIYVKNKVLKDFINWEIDNSLEISDHAIVKVMRLRKNQPFIGQGLERMNAEMVDNPVFRKRTSKILVKLQKEIEYYENEINKARTLAEKIRIESSISPQIKLHKAKIEIMLVNKQEVERKKKEVNKDKNKVKMEKNSAEKQYRTAITTEEKTKAAKKIAEAKNKLATIEKSRINAAIEASKARFENLGEKSTKWFFQLGKGYHEPLIINAMKKSNGEITTDKEEMKKVFQNHHENLMKKPETGNDWEEKVQEVMKDVDKKLTDTQKQKFETLFTRESVKGALKKASNGKAPGADGIVSEFWKSWPEPKNDAKNTPDVVGTFCKIFHHIEAQGVQIKNFTEGIMSILYKKGDKLEAKNYRPVTLLNTDYKIMTKTIAIELGKIAPDLVHPNQTGFIPGRGLFDNVQLTHMTLAWCEQTETNGSIIGLDQEKAYDMIAHKFLWKVLEKFNFPEIFINLVREVYTGTSTRVLINGLLTDPVKIERGVRQGDPMSCILYTLAIEPLGVTLRNSELKGLEIPGVEEKVLVSMFADDTLIYLNKNDDKKVLDECLNIFCAASTAKFNKEKTEYLPFGSEEHRKELIETRKLNEIEGNGIEPTAKIIKDKESMRQLGGRVGNHSNETEQWENILKRQEKILDQWKAKNLSLKGKELVLKALVNSLDQFLATVNSMPEWAQKATTKITKAFIWDGRKKGLIDWKWVTAQKEEGGLNMPSIELRCEAIEIMWLQKWLSTPDKRHTWAYILDELLTLNMPKKPIKEKSALQNWVLQNWHESDAEWNKLPKRIKTMLKVARKYNISVDPLKVALDTKRDMPIWHHIETTSNQQYNKKYAKCLRNFHSIKTVGDLKDFIDLAQENDNCTNLENCLQNAPKLLDTLPPIYNPLLSTPGNKDYLDHTPSRKRKREELNVLNDTSDRYQEAQDIFNPDITERDNPLEMVRIFRSGPPLKKRRLKLNYPRREIAYRNPPATPTRRRTLPPRNIEIFTSGSVTNNGAANAKLAFGIWAPQDASEQKKERITWKGGNLISAQIVSVIEASKIQVTEKKTIWTDTDTIPKGLNKVQEWENKGWQGVQDADLWKKLVETLRSQPFETSIKQVKEIKGQPNIGLNKVKNLAKEGLKQKTKNKVEKPKNLKYVHTSARLSTLQQHEAYALIKEWKVKRPYNKSKQNNIKIAQATLKYETGWRPKEEAIWLGLYQNDIKNNISDFIWKILHNRIRCGNYFTNMNTEEWKMKQFCACGAVETIEHILLECDLNKAKNCWEIASTTWKKIEPKAQTLPEITMGLIMGLPAVRINHSKKKSVMKEDMASTSRIKTIVSQMIWMIWKIRNKRIFYKKQITSETIENDWKKIIKNRVEIDFKTLKTLKKTNKKLTRAESKLSLKNLTRKWNGIIETSEKGELLAVKL